MTAPTPQQIALVQGSFEKVVPIGERVAQLFYGRLFEIAPDVKPFFKNDMQAQGRKLMTTLALIAGALRNLDTVMPAIKLMAVNHVKYGVEPDHYRFVGEALLWALEQGLGADYTPEVAAAWTATYGLLSETMIAAAYGAQAAA